MGIKPPKPDMSRPGPGPHVDRSTPEERVRAYVKAHKEWFPYQETIAGTSSDGQSYYLDITDLEDVLNELEQANKDLLTLQPEETYGDPK